MKRHTTLLGTLILVVCSSTAFGDWEYYEETSLKGTISGTIKKGHVFQTLSGSIYQVSDLTLQLVLEFMPDVLVLRDGEQFKLIVEGFDEPLICKQLVPPTAASARPTQTPETKVPPQHGRGRIVPKDLLTDAQKEELGLSKLTDSERERLWEFLAEVYLRGVDDGRADAPKGASSDARSVTPSVIESQIDGEFEGWEGETIVKLVNGQIWQQLEYHYHYHYAYSPDVLIYRSSGTYKMKVDGVEKAVGVTRIK